MHLSSCGTLALERSLIPKLVRSSWLRLVVEKPFGKDLESSEALAESISKHYPEEQVRGPPAPRLCTCLSACICFSGA